MKKSVTIGNKMLLIGIISVVGLCIFGGNTYITNSRGKEAAVHLLRRSKEIEAERTKSKNLFS